MDLLFVVFVLGLLCGAVGMSYFITISYNRLNTYKSSDEPITYKETGIRKKMKQYSNKMK